MAIVLRADGARVRVPASSANLGPGFDAVGLGLDLWDDYSAEVTAESGWQVEVVGEGAGEVPLDDRHLVARAMSLVFDAVGVQPPGIRLTCANVIPHGKGVGSSAAAIVGGLALGRALLVDGPQLLSDDDLLQLAMRMESHPDNISASLFGGLTLSWVEDSGRAGAVRLDLHDEIVLVLAIPGDAVPTEKARAALPGQVPMADAVFNVARAAILAEALTRRPELLIEATRDRLHQEPRRAMYAASMALVDRLRARGVAAVISGAGPTVLAFAATDTAALVADLAPTDWQVLRVAVAARGVHERGRKSPDSDAS